MFGETRTEAFKRLYGITPGPPPLVYNNPAKEMEERLQKLQNPQLGQPNTITKLAGGKFDMIKIQDTDDGGWIEYLPDGTRIIHTPPFNPGGFDENGNPPRLPPEPNEAHSPPPLWPHPWWYQQPPRGPYTPATTPPVVQPASTPAADDEDLIFGFDKTTVIAGAAVAAVVVAMMYSSEGKK